MATAEQTAGCRHLFGRNKRHAKRWLHRVWRRWAKRDPENAPKRRPIAGWAD